MSKEWAGDTMLLVCSCCGRYLNEDENASAGQIPYPHDNGYGLCLSCGGDRSSEDFKTRIGYTGQIFYESRFKVVRDNLDESKQKRFDEMSYERKCILIGTLIEKGIIF